MKYNFYYDESEHSREIGLDTVMADNYCDNFVTAIVGWKADEEKKIEELYVAFEEKYSYRKNKEGEIKSTTIKSNQIEHGFASMNKETTEFLSDYLSLFSGDTLLYFSSISKIEYIVDQLFSNYQNDIVTDIDAFKYSITKALVINKPKEVTEQIYINPSQFVNGLRAFLRRKIILGQANPQLKQIEMATFHQALLILEDSQPPKELKWDYRPPFLGFDKYLKENSIDDYSLVIDREGDVQNTAFGALSVGLHNVSDEVSTAKFSIRMADILAGIIAKMMKSLCRALHPENPDSTEKTLLSTEWFKLNDKQLLLYKKLHYVICELNNSWFKSYAGRYSDDFISFIALLRFMNHFSSAEEIVKDISMQGEYFNGFLCQSLSDYFERMQNKLPFDPVTRKEKEQEFCLNQRGAKVFFDPTRQLSLPIHDGENKFLVLSVGFDKHMNPLVTIEEDKIPICYRIPDEYGEWAINCVAFANCGEKMFPAEVVFTKQDKNYSVSIL